MRDSYTKRRIRALSERGKLMAAARWRADRARRDAEAQEIERYMAEIEAINLPRKQGDALGSLQWTDFATGKVRRWTVRIGDRTDRITLEMGGKRTRSSGWTWALNHLRGFLAGRKF